MNKSCIFYPNQSKPSVKVFMPTVLETHEIHEDGTVEKKQVILEKESNPLLGLKFSDFNINECLRHGIMYKSLAISKDLRLGFDSEIDAFNEKLESVASKMFNVKSE